MRASMRLGQQVLRLTFFTRPNCQLCDEAKYIVFKVQKARSFEYNEIDVMAPNQDKWKSLYEFDTPVLHIDKSNAKDSGFETTTRARKLLHRFTESELEKAMNEVNSKE